MLACGERSEPLGNPQVNQARKDKQATKASPLTFVACPASAGEKPLALMG